VERNPSLYGIAGQLDKLLYTFDGTPFREVLLRHRENLRNFIRVLREYRRLEPRQADQLLYKIEDAFDKIESELD